MVRYKFNGKILLGDKITKLKGDRGQIAVIDNNNVILFKDIIKMTRLKYNYLKRQNNTFNSVEIKSKDNIIFEKYDFTKNIKKFITQHKYSI